MRLIAACHYGHLETVQVLLATAIDVNHVNRLGWTALLEAVILGDGEADRGRGRPVKRSGRADQMSVTR